MITTTSRAQIYHPEKRGFLFIDHSEADVGREDRCYQWKVPATSGQRWSRNAIERFLNVQVPAASEQLQAQFEGCIMVQAPVCACCGDVAFRELSCVSMGQGLVGRDYRCSKHRDRNPCAIEGCKRTTDAKGRFANDQWLCSDHWRRYVPPHSPMRRTYHRFFRLAKRQGWTKDLQLRFWRFWDGLVKRARRQSTEGRIDENEINRMFGW
ncbi:hypothetical protein [Novosphingobium sp. KN65.2]|uniref:hypothetical protein n=1 Tax=Novosphingobium sp. KN65.2 TaxID=1478134 RepID=UPI0005E5EE95|nr:hypothetical protein [Novosphingobium sp. KN65.2]CDO34010.1 hypothetical protein SPHV1_100044 [Novosphingobium sp. KN65.2]